MYKRTYSFLEKTKQIYRSQYGFRSKHSCEQAVSEFLSEIIKNNEQGKDTVAVYLDLSKAFDTLNHKLLLNKLEQYGIRGLSLQWYDSYLKGCTLRAKCNTVDGLVYSSPYEIEYGTPQGSCLGPLLFLLFTNDLHLHLLYCKCILFADDTTLYMSHEKGTYMEWCVHEDLKILKDWFQANQLMLNLDKTVCMHFGGNVKSKLSIAIGGITLPVVTHTKFLGIWIDNKLTWQVHLDHLALKLIRNTNLLRRGQNLLNMCTKKTIYYAHIYSHLVYGCTIWGNMLRRDQLDKLQKLQNNCIRLITKRKHTSESFQLLQLLTVSEIIKLQNLKLGFQVQHSRLPEMVAQACRTDAKSASLEKKHKYNTRRKREPNRPRPGSKWYNRSFLVKSMQEFQSLPDELKKIENQQHFVQLCKKHLLSL